MSISLSLCLLWAGTAASLATLVNSFQAGSGHWHLGTLAVGNLDDSPDLEIIVPYRDSSGNWFLDAFRVSGERVPGFPYSGGAQEINTSPTLYDVDGDGRFEILFTCGDRVIALRGDGSVLWSTAVNAANYLPNGGYQTIRNGFYWSATGAYIAQLPATAQFSSQVSPPLVVDLAGNGRPEVITGWKIDPDPSGSAQDYNPFINDVFAGAEWGTQGETWSGGVVSFDALTGQKTFVYHLHQLLEAGLSVGRPRQGAPLHIYALNDSDSVVAFDKSQPHGLWGSGMLHGQFGKNQRLMSGSYQVPIDIYTADITGDGLAEVLVAGTQWSSLWQPNETILDQDGGILWRRWLPHVEFNHQYGWLNSACLIPVNPDHDNHADVLGFNHSYQITFRYWNGVELVDHPGWPKSFYPNLPTPPVVGDVDGDGAEEIVIGTYNPTGTPAGGDLFVFGLDGVAKSKEFVAGGVKHIPALADVNRDGRLEVVCRTTTGRLELRTFGNGLSCGSSWSTHRGNMQRDGNTRSSLFPPGTPLVTNKHAGHESVSFSWEGSLAGSGFRILRAMDPAGPFTHIATLGAGNTHYTDSGLVPGCQYIYEVVAVLGTNAIHSAPFALLPLLNGNLLSNPGFEENDNSHWDKWFNGSLTPTNMVASSETAVSGRRAMKVVLENEADSGSIGQYNQYGIPTSSITVTPGEFYSFGGYLKSKGMTQPSQHWFEWTSTKTAADTNARPSRPWPNYFTPYFSAGAGSAPWTYLNRVFRMPDGLPNIEFAHRFRMSAPGSGAVYLDNLFFRRIPAPSSTNWNVWLPFGSLWRYQTDSPAANWFQAGFDDSKWPAAIAKFGAGSGPTNIATRLPQFRPAYFFRKTFHAAYEAIEDLLLAARCTDDSGGAIYPIRVFLNGAEVDARIETVTSQGNETRYFDLTPFAGMIRPGTNLLSVLVTNVWSSWDDVAFDLSLRAVTSTPATSRAGVVLSPGTSARICARTPAGTIWKAECNSGDLSAPWHTLQVITNLTGGAACIEDNTPPRSLSGRLYRLVPF